MHRNIYLGYIIFKFGYKDILNIKIKFPLHPFWDWAVCLRDELACRWITRVNKCKFGHGVNSGILTVNIMISTKLNSI